jgi:hypothetical protein
MITFKVENVQGAQEALAGKLQELITTQAVTIGIHEDANARDDGELNNATIGAINNFGTETIPARPWLKPGVEKGINDYIEVVREGLEKEISPEVILEQIGLMAVGNVQEYMTELKTPPNALSTIKQKGFNNPLIRTGELRAAVNYKITPTLPTEGIK